MINKSTFDTIHAGKFVLHSYLLNDINGCKDTIYIRIHCLLHYIIIMRFLCVGMRQHSRPFEICSSVAKKNLK